MNWIGIDLNWSQIQWCLFRADGNSINAVGIVNGILKCDINGKKITGFVEDALYIQAWTRREIIASPSFGGFYFFGFFIQGVSSATQQKLASFWSSGRNENITKLKPSTTLL